MMEHYGLSFDHLGLAIKHPDKAIRFLKGLGYSTGKPVHDPLQNVNLVWCRSRDMPAIELIYAPDDSSDSPIDNILRDHNEMIYHQCYRSDDTDESIQAMKDDANRVICISPAKPAVLFGHSSVSFYLVVGFGLIEIIEQ